MQRRSSGRTPSVDYEPAHTRRAVWLFAFLVPAVGLARGAGAGAIAGLVAAPILHQVETGVFFDPLDPQGPFGILILVALGAVPGHLMSVARLRRVAERPYKPAWSEDEALEERRRLRAVHFDPELTDLFLTLQGA